MVAGTLPPLVGSGGISKTRLGKRGWEMSSRNFGACHAEKRKTHDERYYGFSFGRQAANVGTIAAGSRNYGDGESTRVRRDGRDGPLCVV